MKKKQKILSMLLVLCILFTNVEMRTFATSESGKATATRATYANILNTIFEKSIKNNSYIASYYYPNQNLLNETAVSATETNTIISGECGENVHYELNTTTGVLRIYGNGAMADYGFPTGVRAPWMEEYGSIITKVKIEDGVTSIGSYAFCKSTNSSSAFENLNSVELAESVTHIGRAAFSRCESLKTIRIPNGVKTIKEHAFYNTPLSDIQFGESLQTIGVYAFSKTLLSDVQFGESLQTIGDSAFSNTLLSDVQFGESLQTIGDSAFSNTKIKNVTIPDNCEVGYSAFEYCDTLESVSFGENCKIHGQVFRECSSLNSIILGEGCISVTGNTNAADYGTFRNCTGLQSILLPNSWEFYDGTKETEAYYGQFTGCTNLKSIQFTNSNKKYKSIDNVVYSIDGKKNVYYPSGLTSTEYEIPYGVMEIGNNAFEDQDYLENISVPSTVNKIGARAFQGCSKLNNVIVPEGIVALDARVFANCKSLKTIVLPASLETIDMNYKLPTATFDGTVLDVIYGESGSYTEEWAGSKFQNTIYCFFDANGGFVGAEKTPVIYNDKYRNLPEPIREGYKFSGWYTKKESGNVILKDTVVSENTSHTLYAHWEADVTTPKSISEATITLDTTNYTYDGTEKKPSVTVKDGSTTLINGTHYIVSYINNIDIGTATVIVSGIGNYSGKISTTFTISAKRKDFSWNKDNWNFNNNSYQGYFSSGKYINQINNEYLNKLKNNLTNSEYKKIFDSRTGWLYKNFGGSCYGMSSTSLLAMGGILPYSNYGSGATNLYQLSYPLANDNISSLITYYQMLQIKNIIQQQYRTVPDKTHKENIQNIISLLDENDTVLIGFQNKGCGHAILAYGYEYGSYTWNGVSYQGCIKICDPNQSTAYNKECNIYFNTSTYNWTIPYYSYIPITSVSGATFNYIGANINEINYGGYLSGTSSIHIPNYVGRINAAAVSENRSVVKVRELNGNYVPQNNASDDIVEAYSYILGGESEGTIGYNLYDAESAYKLSQDNAEKLQLSIDYEDCYLEGGAAAGKHIIFDNDGYVSVSGESSDFNISMTFDDDYPTDWFTIQISGTNSNEASLEKIEEGYIISGDNLENIEVSANNKEDSAHAKFSTKYSSAYIYEIDEDTIGVNVDTDNNGTYETMLNTEVPVETLTLDKYSLNMEIGETYKLIASVSPSTAATKEFLYKSADTSIATIDENGKITAVGEGETTITVKTANSSIETTCTVTVTKAINSFKLGDVNKDGKVDSTDALAVLKHDVNLEILAKDILTSADVNADGFVNSTDALDILKLDVGIIDHFKAEEQQG